MTKLSTRIEEIFWIEGFKIMVLNEDGMIDTSAQSVLEKYEFVQCLTDTKTVADWKRLRFFPIDDEHTCEVLFADGNLAGDDETLQMVRLSYA